MFGIIIDIVEAQNLKDELHKEQVKELNEQLSWSNQNNLEAEIYEQSLKERIAELEAQIEKMKCCNNCFYDCEDCNSKNKNCDKCPCGTCVKHNHWELRR